MRTGQLRRDLWACLVVVATLFLLPVISVPAIASERRIAITFDDAPRAEGPLMTGEERAARLVTALGSANVKQAAFFVTTSNIQSNAGEKRLLAYAEAGHVLANHGHSHLSLSRTDPVEYVADIDRAQQALTRFPNHRMWYRFPYLDEGTTKESRDVVRQALAARGLSNGYVTIDNYDWYLDQLWRDALKAGLKVDMNALRELYIEVLMDAARFYDGIAVEALGRSPAHVLLLHETDLNALFVADLVDALKADGWSIVTADEAFQDPIATELPETLFNGQGRVAAIAAQEGRRRATLIGTYEDEETVARLFHERVVR